MTLLPICVLLALRLCSLWPSLRPSHHDDLRLLVDGELVNRKGFPDDIWHNEETPLHNQVTHDPTMASKSSSLTLTFEASEFANRWRWPTRLWEVLTVFNALPVTIARLSGSLTLFPFYDTPSSSFSNVATNAWSRIVPAFSSKDSRQNTPCCSGWLVFKGESAAPSCRANSNSSRQRRAASMSSDRALQIRRSTLSLRFIGVRLNSKLFTQTVIWRAVIMRRGQTRAHLSRRRRHEARCQTSCSTSIWRQHVWFGAGKWGHFARAPVEKYRGLAESHIAECANARFRPPFFFCTLPPTCRYY